MSEPPAILSYVVVPGTVARSDDQPSRVLLMIAVSNTTERDVTCEEIVFSVPCGSGPGDLTEDAAGIVPLAAPGTHWTGSTLGPGRFSWTPNPGHDLLYRGTSVAFLLDHITVNRVPGPVQLTGYELTDATRRAQVAVTKTDSALGISSFTAVPIQVDPRQRTVLSWSVTGASDCTLTPSRERTVPNTGTLEVTPSTTTTYTLAAEGKGHTTQAQLTVVVPEVRALDFRANPREVARGGSTRLSWLSLGANEAAIIPGDPLVPSPDAGHADVEVTEDTRFTFRAASPTRSDSLECPVRVMPVDLRSFTVTPTVIAPGDTATLAWATEWTQECILEPGGPVAGTGELPVRPTTPTTYRLRADGKQPRDATVTVGVGAALTSVGLQAADRPDAATLTWSAFVGNTGQVRLTIGSAGPLEVPPVGTWTVPLPAEEYVSIFLDVTLDTSRARLELSVRGPLASGTGRLDRLHLACAPGLNTTGGTATVAWRADTPITGRVVNAQQARQDLRGDSGAVDFGLGLRAPRLELWRGDLQVGSGARVGWRAT